MWGSMVTKAAVGVDADNVLDNLAGRLLEVLNTAKKFSTPLTLEDVTRRPFHLSPSFEARSITKYEVSKILDDVWCNQYRAIRVMDERIPEVLAHLRESGIEVNIITTMGSRDKSTRPNMIKWLELNKVPYDKVVFVESSAEKLKYPVCTIVDDEQQLAIDLAKLGRPGLVYDAPWNRGYVTELRKNPNPLIIPVANWSETGERMLEIAGRLRT